MKNPKTKRVLLSILAVAVAGAGVYLLFPGTREFIANALAIIVWILLMLLILSPLLILIYYGEKRRHGLKSGAAAPPRENTQTTTVVGTLEKAQAKRKQAAAKKAWEERRKEVRAQVEREREEQKQAGQEQIIAQEEQKEKPQDWRKQMCREQNEIMRPFLPPELAGRIPAADDVMIEGCGLPWSAPEEAGPIPKDVIFSAKDGPYVRYGYIGERRLQKFGRERFLEAVHPFIEASAPADAGRCAGNLYDYIPQAPGVFMVFRDRLEIGFFSGNYSESADSILFYAGTSYSYHDGGGGSGEVWGARRAPGMTPPAELCHEKRPMSRIAMPSCRGYWLVNDRCYLLEPWDMPGVFEFYSRDTYQASYDSEEDIQQIGTRFD